MNAFIRKECRASQGALIVPVVVTGLLAFMHHLLRNHQAAEFAPLMGLVFLVAAPYLGALPFGHEFDHQTLSLCLLEPKRRMRVWGEKLLTAAVLLALFTAISLWGMWSARLDASGMELDLPLCLALNAVAAGPLMVFVTRSTLGGAGCSFLGSVLQLVLVGVLGAGRMTEASASALGLGLSLTYSATLLLVGAWVWCHHEVRESPRGWLQPHSLGGAFRTGFTQASRSQPLLNVWRREWMLQRSNAILAAALALLIVLTTLSPYIGHWEGPALYETIHLVLPILLFAKGVVLPLLAGIACGNDVQLRTTFLVLPQPRKWRRQMGVRLALGLGIALIAGSMPLGVGDWIQGSYGHLMWWGPSGLGFSQILTLGLGAACFAIGRLSSQLTTSSLKAVVLGGALSAILMLGCLEVHEWLGPKIVRAFGPYEDSLVGWDLRQLSLAVDRSPVMALAFVSSLVGYVGVLLHRAFQNSPFLHVPRRPLALFFVGVTVLFLVAQLGLSVWICMAKR